LQSARFRRNIRPALKPAAVSAHVNAAIVATFLRQVLKRNNIDDQAHRLTVNCVVRRDLPERRSG
jgi:Zn-dependent metalloprotease